MVRSKTPRARARKPLPAVIIRHGQQLRFRRGEIEVRPRAVDPDGRIVSQARILPVYVKLQRRDSLTRAQSAAAEHYAELVEIESGARWAPARVDGIYVAAWQRSNASEAQSNAAADLRLINRALGTHARGLVAMLVIGDMELKDIAVRLQQTSQKTLGQVCAALEHLAEIWVEHQSRPRRRKKSPPAPASSSRPRS